MKKILAWITFLLFPALFASVFFANRAEAGEYRLQTPNFQVEATANPFGVAVKDGRGADILKHDPQAGAYLLKGDQKLFLKGCTEKSHSEGAALSLECAAGEKAVAVEIAIESDFEFSLTLEVPEIAPFDRLGHRFALPEGESIYGLKEHVVGDGKGGTDSGAVQKFATLDQRGSTVEMYVRPTISIYSPFHINSRGFGLFFDTSWPGVYDLGDTEPEIADIGFEGKRLAMHFTYGPGFGDIIERHTDRVGKSILPPIWAAQVFKWRDDHINLPMLYDNSRNPSPFNSMVYEDIKMLKDLGIPTGVYWLDRPWAKGPFGYDDFEFDPVRFPKAGEMIDWLENKVGMKALLWVAPWAYGKMRDVAWAKRYIAPNSDKAIDLTNPKAVEWWQGEFHKMFDLGVAGFKLDRGEEVVPSAYEDIYHDGRTGREVHNQYPMLYAKAVQGACQKFRGDDCLVMPRSGFTGSQRHAVFWGGDTHASWRGLRSAVISCLRAGLMGFSVWGSDTGGYGEPESQDLFSRWLQAPFTLSWKWAEAAPTNPGRPPTSRITIRWASTTTCSTQKSTPNWLPTTTA